MSNNPNTPTGRNEVGVVEENPDTHPQNPAISAATDALNVLTENRVSDALTQPESYTSKLKRFLDDFIQRDGYAQFLIQKAQVKEGIDILEIVCAVHESTGIDLMKEAFYQYFIAHGQLPEFLTHDSTRRYPDLRSIYSDDPRLHSGADFTLGEYIDDWREKDVTEDEKFWCEITEQVRQGISDEIEDRLVEQFSQQIERFPEKPDVISLMPANNTRKLIKSYQMYKIGEKLAVKTGIPYSPETIKKTKETPRAEEHQGDSKYFGRRKMLDGALSSNESDITGKNILLLDDGFSSGASMDEAKKTLYQKGAKNVYSLCIVRC